MDHAITDWSYAATVRIKNKGAGRLPTRRVPVTGTTKVKLNRTQVMRLVGSVCRGEEAFISYGGEDIIRIYPYLDARTDQMVSLAETLGNFRSKLFTGLKLNFTSAHGGRDIPREEFDLIMAQARASRRAHVTPDTLVTCPKCGTEFRVGKKLV